MFRINYVDLVGGLLLVALGAVASMVAIQNYPLGSVQRMGPGMFPAILGVVLAGLGVLLSLQGLRRTGNPPDIRVLSPLFVLGGVASFAVLMPLAGLIPAILGVVVISSFAELKIRPVSLALLCVGLCLAAPLVFVVGLGLPIQLIRWPF